MADYTLQYPGATIDVLLGKVNNPDSTPTNGSTNLVTSGGVEAFVKAITGVLSNLTTENKTNLVAAINEAAQTGGGGGVVDITTQEDGTIVFVFANEDTISVNFNHTHDEYSSKVVGTAIPSGGFLPDEAYNLGTLTGSVAFSLAAAVSGQLNHYFWIFNTGSTAPTITAWPSSVTTWSGNCVNNNVPAITTNKRYEVSIIGSVGLIFES